MNRLVAIAMVLCACLTGFRQGAGGEARLDYQTVRTRFGDLYEQADQRETVSVMKEAGLPDQFIVTPNIGHWYPADLAERIDQVLRHVTESPFTRHEIASGFSRVNNVHAADVDGDGDLDVLATAFTLDAIRLWYNLGGSPLEWSAQNIELGLDGAHFIHSADIDADGDLDLLTAGQLAWFRNDSGRPVSWTKYLIDETYPGAQ